MAQKSTKKAASEAAESTEEIVTKAAEQSAENMEAVQEKPIVPKRVDQNDTVVVRNGFQGRLVYISKRTGERWVWDKFGSEQEIELKELRNAKNSAKPFFENNWFMFKEPWVIDYLGVRPYYKNSINIDKFDDLFKLDADVLKEKLSKMPKGQKSSVAYRAKELIASGEIDSRKRIAAIEAAIGVELIEH